MGHQKPVPHTWGVITFKNLGPQKVQARAWFIAADGTGSYRRATGPTKAAAKHKLLGILQGLVQSQAAAQKGSADSSLTVADLSQIYLDRMDELDTNASTKHEQARLIRRLLIEDKTAEHQKRISKIPLTDLTVKHVDEFYQPIAKHTRAQARNALSELRKVCDLGVVRGDLTHNPARKFKRTRKRLKKEKYAPEPMELGDLHSVVVAFRTRSDRMGPAPSMLLEDIIEVVLGTSARIGEAVGLKWVNIDLNSAVPTVAILGTVVEKSATGKYYQEYPKTESGLRAIPIPDFLVRTLRRRLVENVAGNPYVFHTASGRVNGPQDVHRTLRSVREWSTTQDHLPSISEQMVPRALRKSVASTIANRGSLKAATETLGHKHSRVTEDHYIKRAQKAPDVRHILDALAPWAEPADDGT